ncbi:hypothetical protein QZH41_015068, partial [Actinostola sp. cb2023]
MTRLLSEFTAVSANSKGVNVFLCLWLNIPLGLLYHKFFHPKRVPHAVRHLVGLLLGLGIAWICLKRELFILLGICLLCYVLTYSVHSTIVHKYVHTITGCLWSVLGILLVAQIYRMIESYGTNNFDYTGRLMLLVQRLTYVAFCFHDGTCRNQKDLNEWQEKQRIQKVPNLLEYFSYLFHFGGFLVGPCYTYMDYINFIEGKDMENALAEAKKHVRKMLWIVLICAFVTLVFGPRVPLNLNGGEMAVISCGMGFSGYDENGNELWENARSISIINVEFPTTLKMVLDNWNVFTSKWLRRVVHERVPYQKAAITFLTSLVWHGLYPGYFLIATSSFLFNQVSKEARRAYGHVYKEMSPIGQKRLMALIIFVNVILLTYCTIPFPLLRFDLGIQFL